LEWNAVTAYFKVISQDFPSETEGDHDNLSGSQLKSQELNPEPPNMKQEHKELNHNIWYTFFMENKLD
jgi:hypothetical protein